MRFWNGACVFVFFEGEATETHIAAHHHCGANIHRSISGVCPNSVLVGPSVGTKSDDASL